MVRVGVGVGWERGKRRRIVNIVVIVALVFSLPFVAWGIGESGRFAAWQRFVHTVHKIYVRCGRDVDKVRGG